jgi:hypothetical protein
MPMWGCSTTLHPSEAREAALMSFCPDNSNSSHQRCTAITWVLFVRQESRLPHKRAELQFPKTRELEEAPPIARETAVI